MKEKPKNRIERKNKEFKYAVYRTTCAFVGNVFQILGFILSVLIFWKVSQS